MSTVGEDSLVEEVSTPKKKLKDDSGKAGEFHEPLKKMLHYLKVGEKILNVIGGRTHESFNEKWKNWRFKVAQFSGVYDNVIRRAKSRVGDRDYTKVEGEGKVAPVSSLKDTVHVLNDDVGLR
ncbi:hypothetical protein Tco_0069236 [Tanacetum coccineum]